MLAFDFVAAYSDNNLPFFVKDTTTVVQPLAESPQQITLRFTPGVKIDPASLGGISVVRSGAASDALGGDGGIEDIPVALGSITVDDAPNENQVVIRFAETLPDDNYRITIQGASDPEASDPDGLRTVPVDPSSSPEAFDAGLPDNTYSFDFRVDVGNVVVSVVPQPVIRDAETHRLVIDSSLPAVPTVTFLASKSDLPTIRGTATVRAGETLSVGVNGVVYTPGDGSLELEESDWSLTIPVGSELQDGAYEVTARVVENTNPSRFTTSTGELVVDTSLPEVHPLATSAARPTITGTATILAGQTLAVIVNGVEYLASAEGPLRVANGFWELQLPVDLADGVYQVFATVTDANDVVMPAVATALVIDSDLPAVPTVTSRLASTGTPAISGTAVLPLGQTLRVRVNGIDYLEGAPDSPLTLADGVWTLLIPEGDALDDGVYIVTAIVSDADDNSTSATGVLTVDITAPLPPPTVDALTTSNPKPVVTGTAAVGAGEILVVEVAGVEYRVADAALTHDTVLGTWSLDLTGLEQDLPNDTYQVTATVTDPSGNSSVAVANLVIDTTLPAVPTVNRLATNQTQPVITGTARVGGLQQLTVTVNGVDYPVGADLTLAGNDPSAYRTWTLTIPAADALPADGIYQVTATVAERFQPARFTSASADLVLDRVAPARPWVDRVATSAATPVVTGRVTLQAEEVLTVMLASAALAEPRSYSTAAGEITFAGDVWSLAIPADQPLPDGAYTVTATVTDAAGNATSNADGTLSQARDTVIVYFDPHEPLERQAAENPSFYRLLEVNPQTGADVGLVMVPAFVAYDRAGAKATLTFSVDLPDGKLFRLEVGDPTYVAPVATGSVQILAPAAPVVNTVGVLVDGVSLINDATPTISGTGAAGSHLVFLVDADLDGAPERVVGDLVVPAGGVWNFTVADALQEGRIAFVAMLTDPATGQVSPATTGLIEIDLTPPGAPVIDPAVPQNTSLPTITGTGEPGATVAVYADVNGDTVAETLLGSATVGADSTWTIVATTGVPAGTRVISVVQTDPAGNTSVAAAGIVITTAALVNNVPAGAGGVSTGTGDDFRIAQMEWNGQTVDVVADSWVIRATSAAEALSQIPFGWSVRSLGLDFYGVETPGATTAEVTTWAAAASGLAYIEPNAVIQGVARTPNDPRYSDGTLWGLHNTGQSGGTPDADIDAPEAWDVTTGSSNVVIAVIDTGIDYTHPDLAGNIWVNPGEIAGNGVDDDGNGFVDDIHGWDFAYGDSDPMDVHGHGTHCAGTIGAENGNTGIVGVTWDVQIMAIKALDDDGYYGVADTIAAVNYVTMMRRDHGINVVAINASYGGYYYSQAEVDAITVAGDVGVIFVAAAANDTNDNDSYPAAPASYPNDNIIAVAATDRRDQLAWFSNYGQTTVDLAAPGVAIYSTLPGNTYASWQGTSMAAPHVTGVVALLAAEYPNATAAELRGAILAGATANPNPNLAGLVATGGQLNAFASLQSLATPVSRPTVDSRLTNDATPRITGTATVSVGDSLKVAVNGREYLLGGGQLVLNGTAWELDIPPAHALVEGTYPVVATVSNAFESVQGIGTVTIDLTPPAAPTVNPLTTSDTTPTITGTATRAAGDVLTVEVNEVVYQVGTNLTVSGNNWSLTVPVALEDGTYPVRAVVTDAAGNTADDQEDLVVNTAFPVVPTVTSLITNDDPPTITGTATVAVGETLTVSVAGQDYAVGGGDLTHDGTDWTLVVPNPLNEGEYEVTARVAGVADPTRSSVATGTVTVDLTPPAAPTVNPLTTSDTTPTITGTATRAAGDVLTVEVNEVVYQVGTNLTVSGNNWSLTVPVALEDGTYPVRAVVTDAAGNTADDQEDLVVNTAFPVVPTVTSLITNDDPPTITGTATVAVGETLTVSVAGQDYAVGGGDLTHDGTDWTLVVPNALTDGTHNVTATVTDDFDATRFSNAAGFVIVDTTPPAVPTVNGSVSRDNTPSITGTATVADGEELIVLLSGITYRVGEGNLFLSGSDWILFVPQPLADGVHPVTATVTDLAGNASAASANITIDTEAPSIPTVDRLATNNANVVLTGSAVLAAGDVLTVWAVGNRYDNVAVDANDQWQINLGNVPDGTYDILAVVTDPAGNTAADVTVVELFVDTTPPDPPVFGALPPTSDRTPTIRGTGEPGTTLELRADLSGDAAYETVLGTVTVGTDSRWLIVPNQPLPEAANIRLSATLTDAVGNVSDPPTLATITTDTQAPAAPVITAPAPSNDTTPLIAGTAEPGARVIVLADTDGDGVAETFVGEALADNGGNWNVEVTALPENPAVALTVFQADAAGNISPRVTSAIEIDTTDPLAPVVGSLGANGEIPATSDRRPVIFGTGDPGTVVVVLADHDADGNGADTEIGRTQVRADGTWSVQANQDLPFGAGGLVAATIALSAQSIDAAGNASPLAAGSITIDPALASITALPTQGIAQPTISGRGRASDAIRGTAIVLADETLTVAVNGVTYTAGDGHLTLVGNDWALVIPAANALPDGEYIVTTTVAKTANAARFMAVTSRLVVDTTNPSVPTVRALATSDTTPTITGTAVLAAGEVLAVSVGGNQYAAGDGNLSVAGTEWSLTIPLADALGDGDYTVTATVTDAVGNASSNADINNLTIDTTLPVVPTVNEVISNTGEAVITGTATVDIGETLTVEVNGVVYAVGDDLTLDGNNWTLVVPADNSLDDDPYIVTATVSEDDDATRFTTGSNVIVIDTEAPQVPIVDPLVTSDTSATITGSAVLAAGDVLTVSVNGNQYFVGDGNLSLVEAEWSLTIIMGDGVYTVTATVTDAVGNASSNADINNLTIDTTLPVVPTVNEVISNTGEAVITGTATVDIGETLTVEVNGVVYAVGDDLTLDGNNWTLVVPADNSLDDDPYIVTATVSEDADATRFTTNANVLVIDTEAPQVPVVDPLVTSDTTPTITGTAVLAEGEVLAVSVGGNQYAVGDGNLSVAGTEWSLTIPNADALVDGDYTVTATVTDAAGNPSSNVDVNNLTIDTTLPAVPTATDLTSALRLRTITLLADLDRDGIPEAEVGSATIDGNGNWSLTPDQPLPAGEVAILAIQTDHLGVETSRFTSTVAIDTVAPLPPAINPLRATSVRRPTLSGTGEPGATVTIDVPADKDGDGEENEIRRLNTVVGTDGRWSREPTADLPEGDVVVRAWQTDTAGNESQVRQITIVIDPAATTAPQINPVAATFDRRPTITGVGQIPAAGTTVAITITADFDGDGYPETVIGSTNVANDGTWALVPDRDLPVGNVALAATQEIVVAEAAGPLGNNTTFAGAQFLGTLGTEGIVVDGAISVRPTITTPFGSLEFPGQPGTVDEPGHRDVPVDSGGHGLATLTTAPAEAIEQRFYNFKPVIGTNLATDEDYFNVITETQKQRAREIFELYSRYTGIRFTESADQGLTVATGDLRALGPETPPGPVAGLGGATMALMSSAINWGESEYGGGWFDVAMHEIGHSIGLPHSYDIRAIMGSGLPGEPIFPGDYDIVHLAQLYPANGADIDVYQFDVAQAGRLSAETVIARPGQPVRSLLDSVLTLYREDPATGRREMVARNDDSYGRDSFIGLDVAPGTYFIAVTSTGNDAFDPNVPDSGYGGRTDGDYQLRLGFVPEEPAVERLIDESGTPLDGDRDGVAGGTFQFWFKTAGTADTLFVDKAAAEVDADGNPIAADGSIEAPYRSIDDAIAAAAASTQIIRIVGNEAGPDGGPLPYLIGTDLVGRPLEDGGSLVVPAGVTLMIDEGAVLKFRAAIIDVGSSSELAPRQAAAIQVLGAPQANVVFTSWHDDSIGGDTDGVGPAAQGGQWGGIVLRQDSDSATGRAFLNSISQATFRYGGGQVAVDSDLQWFAPIQVESTRPQIGFNTIEHSAGPGIAATPNSFADTGDRIGPAIRGNVLRGNSINGLFVGIDTPIASPLDRLTVPTRWTNTDIVYVLQENLVLDGGVGGYEWRVDPADGVAKRFARDSGRLTIDPGVIVKIDGSRIELERGISQLIAEGTPGKRVIFTSLGDNRYGAGSTFDTNGNLPDRFDEFGQPIDAAGVMIASPLSADGDWGGIVLNAGSRASIDYAYLAFGGGQTRIEGRYELFNVIETHQGDLRLANSRLEFNQDGFETSNSREGRGWNTQATIFARGAQPVILWNDFRDNVGAVMSINANALSDMQMADVGRSTGEFFVTPQTNDTYSRFEDNFGPLVRGNRISYSASADLPATTGMVVRGEEITVESVWDDTDIVHVLRDEIIVQNFHTATGVRLLSRSDSSLVVKLLGTNAGFTAAGYGLDIDDRIGGTVQVVGQPGYPVILTSLHDDTVGASLDILGRFVTDTGNNGAATTAAAGDWRSLKFMPYSNDRNVSILVEAERAHLGVYRDGAGINDTIASAQALGVLGPNVATGGNTWESAQEKGGDETRRLGFEVHGFIAWDDATDVDVYSFRGYAGSEVWIDIDKTSHSLDTMVELLDAGGIVRARSADGQTWQTGSLTGIGVDQQKDAWRGGDFYTVNPKDAGMRLVLPGTVGNLNQYFIRVRSQATYTGATAANAYTNDLLDPTSGVSSGRYELRVRLRQRDEKPGSTVRYADIRYPVVGIDAQGLPRNSHLVGESGESSAGNDSFGSAQYLGNLLQSDRNTISVAGTISTATDVDWYTFALNYEQIQWIGGVNDSANAWSTIFDIDYADGIRGNLMISVFDESGSLIYVGHDSNVGADQPAAGQGADIDDLSRGSLGTLDPFIGPVQLPTDGPTGIIERGDGTTSVSPSAQQRYYVAISSNEHIPTALNAMFEAGSTNTLVRLEPVTSVRRVVEDHIGYSGFRFEPENGPLQTVLPVSAPIIDTSTSTALASNVRPFTLADVTLFVSSGEYLHTVDAFTGGLETTVTLGGIGDTLTFGDLDMRPDGRLYAYAGVANDAENVGRLLEIDTGTGTFIASSDDGIANKDADTPLNWETSSNDVLATAFRRTAIGEYDELWFVVRSGSASKLYRAATGGTAAAGGADATASQEFDDEDGLGYRGNIQIAGANVQVTGIQFSQDSLGGMYGVTSNGRFISIGAGVKPAADDDPEISFNATQLADFSGVVGGFTGLAAAPQNLENGRFRGKFFATTTTGRLVAIDPVTNTLMQNVFDTNNDGIGDSQISNSLGVVGTTTGLAFSPLDINLWHPTSYRGFEDGHGINPANDRSRTLAYLTPEAIFQDAPFSFGGQRTFFASEQDGGASMHFGLEQWFENPRNEDRYFDTAYFNNGQFGSVTAGSYRWQQELTLNPSIGDNYNLPGGAYGSLITNSFSLAGSTYADKPTLYFNYWLETQDRNDPGNMLDSARVFASADGGLTWELLATNNSVRSFPDSSDEELPNFTSLSSGTMTTVTVNNQHVQELFDTASWRQARIDLGEWAGAADLRLRFDFSTAGVFDGFQRGRRPDGSYGPINDIDGLANTTGQFNLPSRGQDNDFGGFFIDDIIVGFAERGELVTGTGADNQSHFTIGTPAVIPVQNLVGEYQLEIRRGTEFMEPSLFTQYDTNIDHVASAGLLGDQNLPREQGQFIVENNFVLYARDYGISIDAGIRGAVSGIPVPGVVRNFPTLNNSRLVPGAVVSNNVVSQSGIAGIRFSGDPSSGSVPVAAVPFGRIVNNTINGSDSVSPSGVGVVVSENAAPTLLNNLLSNLTTAISVDGSSAAGQQTVVSATAYWNAATQVSGGVVQRDAIVLAQDPYRAAGDRNFYLVPNSSAIDSGIDSLEDRLSFRAVNDPLGIAPAPILAPNRDLYGQLRGDDPTQASWPGLGRNVFKDRGAVERIDLSQPTAALIVPLDGSLTGRIDRNDEVHVVRLQVDQARGVTRLVLKLSDIGVGIDKARVVSDAFTVQYSPLAEPADWSAVPEWQDGSDYLFTFLAMSNEVVFESSAVFSLGEYLITVDRDAIRDLADQQLLNNDVAGVGTTAFRIALVDQPGLVTDVSPSLPIGSNTVELKFTAPANEGGSAIVDYVVEVQDPNDPAVWIPLFDGESTDTSVAIPGLVDGIQYTFRIAARNAFLQGEWVEVGPVMPMSQPVISLLNDTNVNDDGITTDGRVLVQDIEATATWQYSTDSGATWRSGVGNQFLLPAGEYAAGAVQVRQSFNGFFSVAGVNAIAFVIDNQLPEAVIDSIEDDVDRITGAVSDGGLTNDPTPTLTITTDEAASAVVVFLDGNNVGPATVVAGTGNTQWTFASGALASGDYIFTVQATDLAGNVGAISVDFAIEIDVDHPAEVGVDLPIPNEEGFARSNTVTVNGIEPTATWQYSVNGGVTWSDEIAADSNTFELADGPYAIGQIQVRQIDAAGNVGQAWENNAAISIDVNPPSAPALTLGPNVANGATRDEAKQAAGVVTVQGEVGAAITVTFNGDVQVTKPVIPGDGTAQAVSLTDGEIDQLGDGEITVTATQTDEAGNEQMVGDASLTFILDTEAPSAPGLVPGPNVANGATRDEAKQAEGVVTVQGEVGAAITVTFNGDVQVTKPVILGDGTAQAVSLDNAEIDQLGDGEITVTATQTDEAGNEQTVAAASLTFILDTVAPSAPELVLGPNVANGATRGDAKQAGGVVTVRGEAGAEITVTFSRGAVQLTKPVISGDGTSQAVSLDDAEIDRLGDGEITVTATQVDAAGNPQTSDAAEIVFTLDTRKPGAVIQSVSDDQAPEVGLIANFGATNDTTPTLTITTDEPASEVRVFRGDIQVGIATAGSSSREWSFTSDALTDGTYEFSAEATDLAGNVSDRSSIRTIVIDTATPTVTITAITDDALPVTGPIGTDPTNDTSPTLSGTTSEPASLVEILRDGQKVGEATLANQGRTWTFTSGLLSSGTYSFTARATDLAGNVATAAPRSITVDTAAPTTVISDATDNVSPVTGPIVVGGVTNDRTPALTITTTEAASGVEVFRNGVRVGNATPDQNRTTWTFTSAELTDGVYDFTAVARDVAGNASVASAVRRVTIDGTQPTVMIVSVSDDVAPLKGSIVDGGRTNDPRPTIYGTISEAINLVSGQGGKVEVLINGEVEGEATINESGTGWNFTPDADLPLGINGEVEYVITARAVDRAGNAGPVSAPLSFVLDGTVSAPTLSGPAANGGMWNQLEFPLTVQAAEPMSQVEVFSSGRLVHRATFVSGSEQSAYTFTARPLTFGDSYSFTARILDRAGNEATSAAYRITIGNLSDPPPPPAPPPAGSAPVIETVIDNHPDETRIVNVARNGTTDDSTPTLRGTAVPNQQVTVTASTGSQVVWTGLTQANADGGWSITATRLANGAYTFTAEGGGLQSVGYSVIIDAAAPITATAVWGPTAPSDTITIDFSEAVSGMTLDVITFTYRGRKVALNGGLVEPVSNRRYVITLPERFLTTAGDYAIILLYDQIRSITDPDRSMDEDDATIPVSPPVADPGMAN